MRFLYVKISGWTCYTGRVEHHLSHPMLSIKLHREKLSCIDELVRGGLFASRSEVIRASIRRMASNPSVSHRSIGSESDQNTLFKTKGHLSEDERLVSVSIKVPAPLLIALDQVLIRCFYTSRSLFVRDAIDYLLPDISLLLKPDGSSIETTHLETTNMPNTPESTV